MDNATPENRIAELESRNADLERHNTRLRKLLQTPHHVMKSKQDFLCNMSHELRTPLNGLLGMADLLFDTPLSPDQREYLDNLRQCGHDLLHIVNNLLELANLERGAVALRQRTFSLRPVLDAILCPMRERAKDKGLAFDASFDDSLPQRLCGDADRLQQIILNLSDNAVKFTPAGKISLRVAPWTPHPGREPRYCDPEHDSFTLHMAIADTGVGLSRERRETVFDAFRFADPLLTKNNSGTGLGLPIARHLTQLMGGDIWCESTPGHGSTFHATAVFKMPCGKGRRGRPPRDPAPMPRPLRVLLVEDEEICRYLAQTMLTRMGHAVTCVENGALAIEFLSKKNFDIVFMDVQMPFMDGITATRIIRAPHSGVRDHDIPVVALTVYAKQEIKQRILEAGMNEYLAKPLDKERLQNAIDRALQKRHTKDHPS